LLPKTKPPLLLLPKPPKEGGAFAGGKLFVGVKLFAGVLPFDGVKLLAAGKLLEGDAPNWKMLEPSPEGDFSGGRAAWGAPNWNMLEPSPGALAFSCCCAAAAPKLKTPVAGADS
jgi:hypothetical protein